MVGVEFLYFGTKINNKTPNEANKIDILQKKTTPNVIKFCMLINISVFFYML